AQAVVQMPPIDNSDVAKARQGIEMMQQYMPPVDTSGVTITDRTIPAEYGEVPLRIYTPETDVHPLPAMLFFHWGGFMLGNLETEHARCVMIAHDAECVVISVDYRLAPEHPFPAALEDAYTALHWTVEHADTLGLDTERIAVGGTSAGGGLAASIALMSRDRNGPKIAFQFMGFPVTDDRMTTETVQAFKDTPNWTHDANINMWDYYLGENRENVSPYAAPMRAEDMSDLPPAYIWTGEFDPLRDEGIQYAVRLMSAGVPVELHNFAGTFHGFDQTPGAAIAKRSQREQVAVIRAALGISTSTDEAADVTQFGHTMIHVADVKDTAEWYRSVFGFAITFITPDSSYAEMDTGSTTLAFSAEPMEREKYGDFVPNTFEALPAGFHLALQVSDLNTTYEKALTMEAVSINPPQAQSWGADVARIRDLNGVLVAIGSH
ncbi:MAG: alpha/beta hydrolase fold domain-containing protein, partial [Chloroflexota bacterium]